MSARVLIGDVRRRLKDMPDESVHMVVTSLPCVSARRKWDQKYNCSEKARAARQRYYYSDKGQLTKRAHRAAYKPTPEQQAQYREAGRLHELEGKYKSRRKKYDQSVKGRAAKAARDKRFASTAKGKFSKRKIAIKRKYQIKTSNCDFTREQWQEIKRVFGQACAYCERALQRLEMDHVVPLSKGGRHTKDNIVPACRKCNAKKGNRNLTKLEYAMLTLKRKGMEQTEIVQ